MNAPSNLLTAIGLAVAGVIVIGLFLAKFSRGKAAVPAGPQFKPKVLLSPNELEFLVRMERAVPELRFLAQVAMGALLNPIAPRQDAKTYYRQRAMFAQKIVDYVAQRRTDGVIVAIVELDDRTHDSARDAKRDAMLISAGYRVVRWQSKAKPDLQTIREVLVGPTLVSMLAANTRRQEVARNRSNAMSRQ